MAVREPIPKTASNFDPLGMNANPTHLQTYRSREQNAPAAVGHQDWRRRSQVVFSGTLKVSGERFKPMARGVARQRQAVSTGAVDDPRDWTQFGARRRDESMAILASFRRENAPAPVGGGLGAGGVRVVVSRNWDSANRSQNRWKECASQPSLAPGVLCYCHVTARRFSLSVGAAHGCPSGAGRRACSAPS